MSSSLVFTPENPPDPLTEGEHFILSQRPVCFCEAQSFAYKPEERFFFDARHDRAVQQSDDILVITDCKGVDEKLGKGFPIRFCKPPCSSISFSPCGNFLLYVTAAHSKPRSPSAEGSETGVPSAFQQRQQEVGIIDVFSDEMRSTCVPLRGSPGSEEPPRVLKAFWAGDAQRQGEGDDKSAFSPLVVVTQKYIQLFKFVHSTRTLHGLKKVPQQSLLAWEQQQASNEKDTLCTGAATPASSQVVFVVAVGQRTLQPFLLDTLSLSLLRVPKIELSLPLWQSLQPQDVAVLTLYGTVFCVHVDKHAARVSLRAITGPLQPDTVLDALSPGDLNLLVLDNLLAVFHSTLEVMLLYDIKPALNTGVDACSSDGLEALRTGTAGTRQSPTKGDGSKLNRSTTVRALGPLIGGSPLAMGPPPHRLKDTVGKEPNSESTATHEELKTEELKREALASTDGVRFVTPNVLIDEKKGIFYFVCIDTDALMHRLLKEKQSLCAAVQVLQNRVSCKAHVLRLTLHALRLEIPLPELQQLLLLLNHKYRQAIELVPLSLLGAGGGPPPNSQGSSTQPGKATIPLDVLLQCVGSHTVVTERDIVFGVFYPFVLQNFDFSPSTQLLDVAFPHKRADDTDMKTLDKLPSRIQPSSGETSRGERKAEEVAITMRTGRSSALPYILSVALEYTRALLMLQILPHKLLQLLLFDLCVFFRRGDLLRQLLQYHILSDSPELLERLLLVWRRLHDSLPQAVPGSRSRADGAKPGAAVTAAALAVVQDEHWVRQQCMDVAFRLQDWEKLVDVLLALKQYKEVIPFLRRYGVKEYPLSLLLRAAAADVAAQERQPGLLPFVLEQIRAWVKECCSNMCVTNVGNGPPNLRDCEPWLPGVVGADVSVLLNGKAHGINGLRGTNDEENTATASQPRGDLVAAVGEVSREYSDTSEWEDAAKGWADFDKAQQQHEQQQLLANREAVV